MYYSPYLKINHKFLKHTEHMKVLIISQQMFIFRFRKFEVKARDKRSKEKGDRHCHKGMTIRKRRGNHTIQFTTYKLNILIDDESMFYFQL